VRFCHNQISSITETRAGTRNRTSPRGEGCTQPCRVYSLTSAVSLRAAPCSKPKQRLTSQEDAAGIAFQLLAAC
jgi:hypothetical protein